MAREHLEDPDMRVVPESGTSKHTPTGGHVPEISYDRLASLVAWVVRRIGDLHPDAPVGEAAGITPSHSGVMRQIQARGFTDADLLDTIDACRVNTLVTLDLAEPAPPSLIYAANLYYVWALLIDDCVAERGRPLGSYLTACGEILRSGNLPTRPDGLHLVCKDIREAMASHGGTEVAEQLADATDATLGSWVQEQQRREEGHGRVLLTDYLNDRADAVAYIPCMSFVRLALNLTGPDRRTPSIRRLERLVALLTGIENDSWSCYAEMRRGVVPDLLGVLIRNHQVPLEHAFSSILTIAATIKNQIDQLVGQIVHDTSEPSPYKPYVRAIAQIPDHQYAWARVTPRYHLEEILNAHPETGAFPAA